MLHSHVRSVGGRTCKQLSRCEEPRRPRSQHGRYPAAIQPKLGRRLHEPILRLLQLPPLGQAWGCRTTIGPKRRNLDQGHDSSHVQRQGIPRVHLHGTETPAARLSRQGLVEGNTGEQGKATERNKPACPDKYARDEKQPQQYLKLNGPNKKPPRGHEADFSGRFRSQLVSLERQPQQEAPPPRIMRTTAYPPPVSAAFVCPDSLISL